MATGAPADGLASADADGDLDLITTNFTINTAQVFANNGSGVYTSASTFAVPSGPQSVFADDLNGDLTSDLIITSSATSGGSPSTIGIFLGDGTLTYGNRLEYAVGPQPYRVTVADLNNDGRPNIAVANGGTGTNRSTLAVLKMK